MALYVSTRVSSEHANHERRRRKTDVLESKERELIEAALMESKGRVAGPKGAATRLGVPASTLESKIRTLKIDKFRFLASSAS